MVYILPRTKPGSISQVKEVMVIGGPHCAVDSILASHPAALGSNPSIPKNILVEILNLLRFINGAAWNSGPKLDNVDQTYLVLASGKLVLQK